jgi:hypothetical protein
MATAWAVLHSVGDTVSVLFTALVAAYWIPGSPVRTAVDAWIQRRVSLQFEKELATFRHRLDLDAEAVRAEHQRLLHNAALVTEKKHEVYRELFRLAHIAAGAFGVFYGVQRVLIFDGYTRAQLSEYLDTLRPPGETKEAVLAAWDADPRRAVPEIRAVERVFNLDRAERATKEAWNYFVLNQLYLNDPITEAAAAVLRKMQALVPAAQGPHPATDVAQLHGEATDLLERLRHLLRDELHVVQPGPAVAFPDA